MFFSRWRYYLSSIPTLLLNAQQPVATASRFAKQGQWPFVWRLRNGLEFTVRSAMDMWIIKETCLDGFYERYSTALQDGWSIIDIGAALGDFAIHAARLCPHSRILAFEPAPDSFELLQQNVARNGVTNIQAFPYAISAPGNALYLDTHSGVPVQYQTVAQPGGQQGAALPTYSLEQVLDQHGLAQCDYIKMDCEGAEYTILFGADPGTIRRVRHWCMEYHDDVTEWTHRDLIAFFERNGFTTRRTPNPAHTEIGWLYAYQ